MGTRCVYLWLPTHPLFWALCEHLAVAGDVLPPAKLWGVLFPASVQGQGTGCCGWCAGSAWACRTELSGTLRKVFALCFFTANVSPGHINKKLQSHLGQRWWDRVEVGVLAEGSGMEPWCCFSGENRQKHLSVSRFANFCLQQDVKSTKSSNYRFHLSSLKYHFPEFQIFD